MTLPSTAGTRLTAAALVALATLLLAPGCGADRNATPSAPAAVAGRAAGLTAEDCAPPADLPRHCDWPKAVAVIASPASQACANGGCSNRVRVSAVAASGAVPAHCTAAFDYGQLVVKHKKGKNDAIVTWYLESADRDTGFAFDLASSAPGELGSGIRMFKPGSRTALPADFWEARLDSEDMQVVRIRAYKTTSEAFCHYPRVRMNSGRDICCPIDPIIINDPD